MPEHVTEIVFSLVVEESIAFSIGSNVLKPTLFAVGLHILCYFLPDTNPVPLFVAITRLNKLPVEALLVTFYSFVLAKIILVHATATFAALILFASGNLNILLLTHRINITLTHLNTSF